MFISGVERPTYLHRHRHCRCHLFYSSFHVAQFPDFSARSYHGGRPWNHVHHRKRPTVLVWYGGAAFPITFFLTFFLFLLELEDILRFSKPHVPTLSQLDSSLRRYLALCAAYHGTYLRLCVPDALSHPVPVEQYLQSPLQLEHACDLLLDSELFQFHSERMCEILVDDLQSVTP